MAPIEANPIESIRAEVARALAKWNDCGKSDVAFMVIDKCVIVVGVPLRFGAHPKFYRFVDSVKKIDANFDRIRSASRHSRPEILGPPARESLGAHGHAIVLPLPALLDGIVESEVHGGSGRERGGVEIRYPNAKGRRLA